MFPNKAKRAIVTPLDKGGKDKTNISNYRPVSVLSVFSKIYERAMKNQMVSFLEYKLSSYLSAYRISYSTQHVLIRLIEEWKGYLDKNYYVGAVLLDLSKAFDCVPHDLIIAKMHAYGFNMDALKLILSYLTNREQATCITLGVETFAWRNFRAFRGFELDTRKFIHAKKSQARDPRKLIHVKKINFGIRES